jgi:hypothetical protein
VDPVFRVYREVTTNAHEITRTKPKAIPRINTKKGPRSKVKEKERAGMPALPVRNYEFFGKR